MFFTLCYVWMLFVAERLSNRKCQVGLPAPERQNPGAWVVTQDGAQIVHGQKPGTVIPEPHGAKVKPVYPGMERICQGTAHS